MITRLRYLAALLLASGSLLSFFSTPSRAQPTWVLAHRWPKINGVGVGWVSAMWFFNADTGIVGFHWNITSTTDGMVERTTDGGNTWAPCMVNNTGPNTTPQISDIWFLNADTGWMTVNGSLQALDYMLYRTNDGGLTWNPNTALTISGKSGGAAAVWQTDSALVVTNSDGGIWTSTDTGQTWTNPKPTLLENGIAFDHLNGVMTSDDFASTSTYFLYSTNGGLQWQNATLGFPNEGWGVHCIKSTGIFVAAPEDSTNNNGLHHKSYVDRTVYANGLPSFGLSWKRELQLPINTTGDVEGVEGILYVQNSGAVPNSPSGLMESTDEGVTWTNVGGPNQGGEDPFYSGGYTEPINDTRFAVTGCGNIV